MGVANEMMDQSGVSASLPFSSQEAGGRAASALSMSQLAHAQQAGAESQGTSTHLTVRSVLQLESIVSIVTAGVN